MQKHLDAGTISAGCSPVAPADSPQAQDVMPNVAGRSTSTPPAYDPDLALIRNFSARRIGREAFWIAVGTSAAALIALGWLEASVSTGFRIYVLTPGFKALLGANVAVFSAVLAVALVDFLTGEHVQNRHRRRIRRTVKSVLALMTGFAALGSLLPDWSTSTAVVGVLVLTLWATGILLIGRARGE